MNRRRTNSPDGEAQSNLTWGVSARDLPVRWAVVEGAVAIRLAAALLCSMLVPQTASASTWVGSWGASPVPPQPQGSDIAPARVSPTFSNQTVVQVVRLSSGGRRLRLRLSNEFGLTPLAIGTARVAIVDAAGKTVPGTERQAHFSGQHGVAVPAGAPEISDPIDLRVSPLAYLKISLYLSGTTESCTCHPTGSQLAFASPPGDYTDRPFIPRAESSGSYRAFLTGVEVETVRPTRVVVTFGDSITDGYLSTAGANQRYPDRLAERLSRSSRLASVVNAGISGNRLVSAGRWITMGPNGLARFDRDVLAVPGVTHVLVLEGINDIGGGGAQPPSHETLIAAYRQLIERAHAHRLTMIGGTILPYEGAPYYKIEGEAVRAKVNDWIRTGGEFDQIIDFDAVMRDPVHPTRLRKELQSGDWLHPNDAGYRAMGDLVSVRIFRTTRHGLGRSPHPSHAE